MKCVKCGAKAYVVNSREFEQKRYRQYTCKECGKTLYTVEQIADEKATNRILWAILDYKKGR